MPCRPRNQASPARASSMPRAAPCRMTASLRPASPSGRCLTKSRACDMAQGQTPREGEILLYTGASGDIHVEVLFEEESFWLTQKRMAELFEVTVPTVNE